MPYKGMAFSISQDMKYGYLDSVLEVSLFLPLGVSWRGKPLSLFMFRSFSPPQPGSNSKTTNPTNISILDMNISLCICKK